MSFVDNYLDKHRLDTMSEKHKKNVSKLEKKLKDKAKGNNGTLDFEEDILKKYGPQIADLVERASQALHGGFSFDKFRVVISIGIEVYQLVDQMADKVIPPGLSKDKQQEAKIEFGKDLTYFIWMTIDPLANYLNWLPFKKAIERRLVRWLAGYALDTALDMLLSQESQLVSAMSADQKYILRTLP